MNSYIQVLNLDLPAQTEAGKIRNQVLAEQTWLPSATGMVSYVSSNRVLIVAEQPLALEIETKLPDKLLNYLAIPAQKSEAATITNAWKVAELQVSGYLGRFEAFIDSSQSTSSPDENQNLGLLFNIANGLFDQVVDCNDEPLIGAAIKPPGYYHVGHDQDQLNAALEQIGELIGEFEKPKFFDYDLSICAHGNSGVRGCTRCLEACPTEAIISIGDKIQVNPNLCQGGGSCASACPSGAISYTYPKAEEQIDLLRRLIRELREINSNKGITLLIYDQEHGHELVKNNIVELPEDVIPFVVEEIGSVGLDLLSCALAYGANSIYLLVPDSVTDQVRVTTEQNLLLLRTILNKLELNDYELSVIEKIDELTGRNQQQSVINDVATFAAVGNKRNVIRSALTFLQNNSDTSIEEITLPNSSLFGEIEVDNKACTLCMACVSVCPGKALQDGGEQPALKFIEANCLQCGICASACPEQAIELKPRIHFDYDLVHSTRVINEEQPFRCLSCGKPFATKSMIEKMTEKLKDHWMFDNPDALKRLQMCEDCRVIDVYSGHTKA